MKTKWTKYVERKTTNHTETEHSHRVPTIKTNNNPIILLPDWLCRLVLMTSSLGTLPQPMAPPLPPRENVTPGHRWRKVGERKQSSFVPFIISDWNDIMPMMDVMSVCPCLCCSLLNDNKQLLHYNPSGGSLLCKQISSYHAVGQGPKLSHGKINTGPENDQIH